MLLFSQHLWAEVFSLRAWYLLCSNAGIKLISNIFKCLKIDHEVLIQRSQGKSSSFLFFSLIFLAIQQKEQGKCKGDMLEDDETKYVLKFFLLEIQSMEEAKILTYTKPPDTQKHFLVWSQWVSFETIAPFLEFLSTKTVWTLNLVAMKTKHITA